MKVIISTIPHQDQRYDTCGDWYFDKAETLIINVSSLGDWRKEACIAVHELVEVLICQHTGVTEKQVDLFDTAFEAARKPGDLSEPGDDINCPCYNEHQIATGVERILAQQLGLSWNEYEAAIHSLPQISSKI